jgi:inorganic pyrophosphatase
MVFRTLGCLENEGRQVRTIRQRCHGVFVPSAARGHGGFALEHGWSSASHGCYKRRVVSRTDFPSELEVLVDHPRGSFIKRREDGSIDYVSPFPSPFNYGSVPDTRAADGDREDAIVLGPRLPPGARVRMPVVARVVFIDAGDLDSKWICGARFGRSERLQVELFFQLYAYLKGMLYLLRRRRGNTEYRGLELP